MATARDILAGSGLLIVLAAAAMGQDWIESDDAGEFPADEAQQVIGSGPLHTITGLTNTAADDFVDAYVIKVTDAANFYATTSSAWDPDAVAVWDTRLFLFDPEGEYLRPPLQGLRLAGGRYRAVAPDEAGAVVSAVLGVTLHVDRATGELHVTDTESGTDLQRPREALRRAEDRAREAEAEVASLRAELARRRRDDG